LYEGLQAEGLLDNSYLILTSDHGEMFERGVRGHVTPLLSDPVIHVPLLISAPGQSARRDVFSPTSCVDLVPSLLTMTGRDVPEWVEGTWLPGFGGDAPAGRPVFAVEAKKNPSRSQLAQVTVAMIQGDYKLTWYRGYTGYDSVYELYDIANDPEELLDLSRAKPHLVQTMGNELQGRLAQADERYRI
jgi:arylsulfatase A-like enzyme